MCNEKHHTWDKEYHNNLVNEIANSHGGKCLSPYIANNIKIDLVCAVGHEFKMTPAHIKAGTWCSVCAKKKKLTIQEMVILAQVHNGKCLSLIYINNKTKLIWECEFGHIWEATPHDIKANKWCPTCAGNKKDNIEHMRKLAKLRNGWCLSPEYINDGTNLIWKCEAGHIWETAPSNIKQGSWCPDCSGKKKLTIEAMQELASVFGGWCLSAIYINTSTKLEWKCKKGHIFKKCATKVKEGQWCNICSKGFGERITREFFQQLFECKFISIRPDYLKYINGRNLELDGFCAALNLAWEYNGEQHYRFVKGIHKTYKDFEKQQARDIFKYDIVKKLGINLLIVKQVIGAFTLDKLKNNIRDAFVEANINIPDNFDNIKVSIAEVY